MQLNVGSQPRPDHLTNINALLSLLNDRFLYILCKMLGADFFSLFPLEEELWKLCRQPGSKGY